MQRTLSATKQKKLPPTSMPQRRASPLHSDEEVNEPLNDLEEQAARPKGAGDQSHSAENGDETDETDATISDASVKHYSELNEAVSSPPQGNLAPAPAEKKPLPTQKSIHDFFKKKAPSTSQNYDPAPPNPVLYPNKPTSIKSGPEPFFGKFRETQTPLVPTKPFFRNPERDRKTEAALDLPPLKSAGVTVKFKDSTHMVPKEKFTDLLQIAEFSRSFEGLFELTKRKRRITFDDIENEIFGVVHPTVILNLQAALLSSIVEEKRLTGREEFREIEINHLTFPEAMSKYLSIMEEEPELAQKLQNTEYPLLPWETKTDLLLMLIEMGCELDVIGDYITESTEKLHNLRRTTRRENRERRKKTGTSEEGTGVEEIQDDDQEMEVEHEGSNSPVRSASPVEISPRKTTRQIMKEERGKLAELEGQMKREERERFEKECEQQEEMERCEEAVGVRPLGRDRHHRVYWWFPSLSALVTEEAPDLEDPSTDKPNSKKGDKAPQPDYAFVTSKESLDDLIDNLEFRLTRERSLKMALRAKYSNIVDSLDEISGWLSVRSEGIKEDEAELLCQEAFSKWEVVNVNKVQQKLLHFHAELAAEDILVVSPEALNSTRSGKTRTKVDPWEKPWKKMVDNSASLSELRGCLARLFKKIEPACLFTKAKTPRQMVSWTERLPQLSTFSSLLTHIDILEEHVNPKGKNVKPTWDPLAFATPEMVDDILGGKADAEEATGEEESPKKKARTSPRKRTRAQKDSESEDSDYGKKAAPQKKNVRKISESEESDDDDDDDDDDDFEDSEEEGRHDEEEEDSEEVGESPEPAPQKRRPQRMSNPSKPAKKQAPRKKARTVVSDPEEGDDDDTIVVEISVPRKCTVCNKASGDILVCHVCGEGFHPKCHKPPQKKPLKGVKWRCEGCDDLSYEEDEDGDDKRHFGEVAKRKQVAVPRKSQRATRGMNGSLL